MIFLYFVVLDISCLHNRTAGLVNASFLLGVLSLINHVVSFPPVFLVPLGLPSSLGLD